MRKFKFVRVMMGSGWPSGHVAINEYHTFPDKPGGGEMCLTLDAENAAEFSREIDRLIEELEELRRQAPKRFEEWQLEWKRARANRKGREE